MPRSSPFSRPCSCLPSMLKRTRTDRRFLRNYFHDRLTQSNRKHDLYFVLSPQFVSLNSVETESCISKVIPTLASM